MQSEESGRLEFDSASMGCKYHQYTRKEALQCMARPQGRAGIAFIGALPSGLQAVFLNKFACKRLCS